MANTLLTISDVSDESLAVFVNNLVMGMLVDRQWAKEFGKSGAKIGATMNIRKALRYISTAGQALVIQDSIDQTTPLVLDQQRHVGLQFGSAELTLSVDHYSDRYLAPAISQLSNDVDSFLCQLYNQVANAVGAPGTTPNAMLTYGYAKTALDNESIPKQQRYMVISSLMETTILDAVKGLFQAARELADQYTEGSMGRVSGFDWHMDQNVATHTVGALGGSPLVNGANQAGTALITDAWTSAAATRLKRGDTFTIGSGATLVAGVNPQSRLSTGQARVFLVTADTASDASGNMTIPIYPPLIAAGAYQTVNTLPADNAAINVNGAANTASPQGLAFHKSAFTLGMADLFLPKGEAKVSRAPKTGVSIRIWKDALIQSDQEPCRADVLFGGTAQRPEAACRVQA